MITSIKIHYQCFEMRLNFQYDDLIFVSYGRHFLIFTKIPWKMQQFGHIHKDCRKFSGSTKEIISAEKFSYKDLNVFPFK